MTSTTGPGAGPDERDAEVEAVTGALLQEASAILDRTGVLYPFAARLLEGSQAAELVPAVTDDDYPDPAHLVAELMEALRLDAEAGMLRCGAIAVDVVVELPDLELTDAVRIAVEHRDGTARAIYLPYRLVDGRAVYRDLIATPAERAIFDGLVAGG